LRFAGLVPVLLAEVLVIGCSFIRFDARCNNYAHKELVMPHPKPVNGPDRLPGLDPADYNPAQQGAAEALIATPRGEVRGPFVPLIRSPELLDRTQALGEYLRYRSMVPARLREFAILTTAVHWRQPYEWAAHVGPARAAGIARETLEALVQGASLAGAEADEQLVHAFATELHTTRELGDETWAATCELLGEGGVIDLIGVCGYYAMLAMVLNGARTAGPSDFAVPE
jgi:4-carboxymuconolactone decarboxylase